MRREDFNIEESTINPGRRWNLQPVNASGGGHRVEVGHCAFCDFAIAQLGLAGPVPTPGQQPPQAPKDNQVKIKPGAGHAPGVDFSEITKGVAGG